MRIKAVKTKLLRPPQDDLFKVIKKSIKSLPNNSVLMVASKVVSLHQGRCILKSKVTNKDRLIEKEADLFLPRRLSPGGYAVLTIKNNILIPTAGIDESNAGEYYILWPEKPQAAAKEIWQFLRRTYRIKNVGVIISDSHTVPLRRGVMGVAVGYWGFQPVNDYRGTKDLFNRKFKVSTVDVADSLAAAGMVAMGEGRERTPLVIISEIPFVRFASRPRKFKPKLEISLDYDLYGPILKSVKWRKK